LKGAGKESTEAMIIKEKKEERGHPYHKL